MTTTSVTTPTSVLPLPSDLETLIYSYVDIKQAVAELPNSLMWRTRDRCVEWLLERQIDLRQKLVAVICRRLRYVRLWLTDISILNSVQAQHYMDQLHIISTCLRFFQQQRPHYISKTFSYYELDLNKSYHELSSERWQQLLHTLNSSTCHRKDIISVFSHYMSSPIIDQLRQQVLF